MNFRKYDASPKNYVQLAYTLDLENSLSLQGLLDWDEFWNPLYDIRDSLFLQLKIDTSLTSIEENVCR